MQTLLRPATMPKVVSYTPPWLSRPSPGATLFSSAPSKIASDKLDGGQKKSAYEGPNRTLAKRKNEVFTVVDNQIRWSDLARLKNEWQQRSKTKKIFEDSAKGEGQDGYVPYRVSHDCVVVMRMSAWS